MIAVTDTGVVPMRVSKAVWVQDGEFNAHFMVLDELDGDRHLVIQVCQAPSTLPPACKGGNCNWAAR